jgi:hypothetical protein
MAQKKTGGGPGPVVREANLYSLHNNVIQGGQFSLYIVYSSSGPIGKPSLEYHTPSQSLSFLGDQIETTALPLGNLVTVTTRPPADTGSTTFTLFVPSVSLLVGQSSTNVNTVGVTTTRRGGIVPPHLNIGQQEFYTVTELTGTAEFVVF